MESFFTELTGCDNESIQEGVKTLADFGRGLVYGAIESPVNGVAQIANTAIEPMTGRSLKLDMTGLGDDLATGQCNAVAAEVGATIGGIIPFYAANKVAGKALGHSMSVAKTAEGLGLQTATYSIGGSLAKGAVTGGVMGAVFTPTAEGENLFFDRIENGALGIAGGALFQGANDASRFGLSKYGNFGSATAKEFVMRELPATVGTGAIAGAGTGFVNAHLTALMKEQRLASGDEMQQRMMLDGIMGGGFSAVHQVHSRLIQASPITAQQKQHLALIKVEESDPALAPMFKRFSPGTDVEGMREIMRRPGGDVAYAEHKREPGTNPWDRMMNGEPATSGDVYALRSTSNDRNLGAAFIENHKKQSWWLDSHPFRKLNDFGVEPQYRNAGIEEYFLKDKLLPHLKEVSPKHIGLVVEIADYKGLPAASSAQTTARFYERLGLQELKMPHAVPPIAPEGARHVRVGALKEFCEKNSLPVPDGPSPARLLWKTFTDIEINAQKAVAIQSSIYQSGYGLRISDMFVLDQAKKIRPVSWDLRKPIELDAAPDLVPPATVSDTSKRIWNHSINAVDGTGFGVVNGTALEDRRD